MFFDTILLSKQHKLGLYWPWIAATRGVKFVPKDKISMIKIVTLCNHIQEFLGSGSHDPRKRFSLRMSALLVNGTIRIIKRQTEILYDETMKYYQWEMSRAVKTMQLVCTPPDKPKKEKRPKKDKKLPVHTPDSLVNVGEQWIFDPDAPLVLPPESTETPIVQARVEEITLREDDTIWTKRAEDELKDSFFGRLDDVQIQPELQPFPELEPVVPAELVPSVPAELVLSVPAELVPSVPAELVPSVPAELVPSVPAELVPSVPAEPAAKPPTPKRKDKKSSVEQEGPIRGTKESAEEPAAAVVELSELQLSVTELPPMEPREVHVEEAPVIQPVVPEIEAIQETAVAVAPPSAAVEDPIEVARKKESKKAKELELRRRQDERLMAATKESERAKMERVLLLKRGKLISNFIRRVKNPIKDVYDIEFALARPRCAMSGLISDPGHEEDLVEVQRAEREEKSVSGSKSTLTTSVRTPSISSFGDEERRLSFATPTGSVKRSHPGSRGESESLQMPTEVDMPPPLGLPRKKRRVVTVEEVEQIEKSQKDKELDLLGITTQEEITTTNGRDTASDQISSIVEERSLPREPEKTTEPIVEVQVTVEPTVEVAVVQPKAALVTEPAVSEVQVAVPEIPKVPLEPEKPAEPKEKSRRKKRVSAPEEFEGDKALRVKWISRITEVVRNWNFEEGELTPVDVCHEIDKEVKKLNMARIFASLLVLCAQQKVLLHSDGDSLELRCVLAGPNLSV